MGNSLSLVRNALNQSFFIPAPPLTEKNLADQTGKVFIITGANSGVGYHVSSILYQHNATVYLACRSASKAQTAISQIQSAHPSSKGKLVFLKLDTSDLSSIKASAEEFLAKESKLHWLDNNAGVMFPPAGSKGAQGYDLTLATNVLGPFLFTQLLLPVLKRTAAAEPGSVRVSWAGSMAVDLVSPKNGVEFKTVGGENVVEDHGGAETVYGTSKAANYFFAREFGRRGADGHGDGILHTAFNPGNLRTGLQGHLRARPIIGPIQVGLLNLALYDGHMGAYTELYAGLSPDLTLQNDQGSYIVPWGRKATWVRPDVKDNVGEGKTSEKLYEWCEQVTRSFT